MSADNLSKKLKAETIPYKELKCLCDIINYDIEFIQKP